MYRASSDSYKSLSYRLLVAPNTTASVVTEVFEAIYTTTKKRPSSFLVRNVGLSPLLWFLRWETCKNTSSTSLWKPVFQLLRLSFYNYAGTLDRTINYLFACNLRHLHDNCGTPTFLQICQVHLFYANFKKHIHEQTAYFK